MIATDRSTVRAAAFAATVLVASLLFTSAVAAHPGAERFAQRVADEQGLDAAFVLDVLAGAEYQQAIIDAITRPAESRPWFEYRPIFLRDGRIADGVRFWREHRALVERVAAEFGVAPEIILAIVGVETNYGTITGSYRVLDALVTLGFYYPKRAEFFAGELAELFSLSREEDLPLGEVRGSYDGAMGIGQFIPSSYRAYAVDFDDSGSRDLWRSLPDALASVANYLAVHGWDTGLPVVLPVESVPAGLDADFPIRPAHTLGDLGEMDVAFDDRGLAPDTPATLIELEGEDGPEHWIGLNNFYVITRYNRSPLYAMAVAQLAERIGRRARTGPAAAE